MGAVALHGESTAHEAGAPAAENVSMTGGQWRVFCAVFIVSSSSMTDFLAKKGVFDGGSVLVLLIVAVFFVLGGIAICFFVRGRTDDLC